MNLEKENTVNIDPTTGLPALPEGYFWEVKPYMKEVRAGNEYGGYSKPWKVKAGYGVHIMAFCLESKQGEKRWPWSKREVIYTETSASVMSLQLIDPDKVAANNAAYAKDVASYEENGWTFDETFACYPPTHYEHITAEIVKAAAIELYTEWQDDLEAKRVAKAKREASEALVGVYPPKVLG